MFTTFSSKMALSAWLSYEVSFFFLHCSWFLQNLEKDFIPTLMHTTVYSIIFSSKWMGEIFQIISHLYHRTEHTKRLSCDPQNHDQLSKCPFRQFGLLDLPRSQHGLRRLWNHLGTNPVSKPEIRTVQCVLPTIFDTINVVFNRGFMPYKIVNKMQGSPDAHLRLACCTSQVKQWSKAMDFLQSLLQNKYFLPKMELLQNFWQTFKQKKTLFTKNGVLPLLHKKNNLSTKNGVVTKFMANIRFF